MSTVSNLNGGRLLPIVRDTASAIKQIKSDLQSMSTTMDTLISKASQLRAAIAGTTASQGIGGSPGSAYDNVLLGGGGTHANGMPIAVFGVVGSKPGSNAAGASSGGHGGLGRHIAQGAGGALLAGIFSSAASSAATMYDQDTLFNRLRQVTGGGFSAQMHMATNLTNLYAGGFISTADRDAAVNSMLSAGVPGSQVLNPSFAGQISTFAKYGNVSMQQAFGMYQPLLSSRQNMNFERALGIPALNWQNGQLGNLDQVMSAIARRGNLTPGMSKTAFDAAFSPSGQFRAFLQDLGYGNDQIQTLEQFYQASQKSGQPVDFSNQSYMQALGPNAQTLINNFRGRATANAQREGVGYSAQRSGIEAANNTAAAMSNLVANTNWLPKIYALLAGPIGGISALPGGGSSLIGNTANMAAHSALDAFFLKTLLGGGRGAGGAMAGGGSLLSRAGQSLGISGGLLGKVGGAAGVALGGVSLGNDIIHHNTDYLGRTLSGMGVGAGLGALFGPADIATVPVGAVIGGAIGYGSALLNKMGIGDGPGVDSGVKLTGGSQNTISQIMAMATGLGSNYRVTSGYRTTGNPNSYHRLGEAVDFAEATPGTHDTPGLLRIDQYFADKYGSSLAELIYAGPGGVLIKDGKRVGPNVFGPQVMAEHHNHVHVALKPGAAAKLNLAHGGDAGSARASNSLAGAGMDSLTYTALAATNAAAQGADYFGLGTSVSAQGIFAGGGLGSSGGGATSGGPNPAPSKGKYSYSQLMGLAQGAGFSASQARIMAAIALAESSGNPGSLNNNARTGDLSYGLWQINMLGSMGPGRRKEFGIGSNNALLNAGTNAHAAFDVFKDQGFNAWSTYKSGAYKQYLQTGDGPGAVSTQNAGVSAAPVTIAPQCNAVFNVNVQSASEAEAIRLAKMAAAHLKEETTKMMIGRS